MPHRLASIHAAPPTAGPHTTGAGSGLDAGHEQRAWRVATVALLVAALVTASAFFTTLRPPLQDLPQHLAAARVLLDGSHPGFHFQDFFQVDWFSSQYLGTYVLLGAFFHPLRLITDEPLLWANRCLLVALALLWPLSTELVYRALGKRAGLGAFALVLFFNVHLILGFLNFLLGIVACFIALACLTEARNGIRRGEPQTLMLAAWGAAALCCFYLHVVPFALLLAVMGVSALYEQLWPALRRALLPTRSPARPRSHATAGPYLAFAPATLALGAWLFTPAGVSTREAARGAGARGRAVHSSFELNWSELQSWLVDSFASAWDTRCALIAIGALMLWLLAEAVRIPWPRKQTASPPPEAPGPGSRPAAAPGVEPDALLLWTLRAFVPVSALLYFALPSSYDWIWPINARFPLFGLLFLPLWLPAATPPARAHWRGIRAGAVTLMLGLAVAQAAVARAAFAGFAREMRGFDELLTSIPPGQRTATLVYDRYSRHVAFAPLLHVGAYYQAERGGVAFFSFADFPQSPVRFRRERRPPPVEARWEWMPERVRVDRDLAWFDYVITCGGPGRIEASRKFEPAGRFGRFRLFRRRTVANHGP
jgi:uncharacterized membrane protein